MSAAAQGQETIAYLEELLKAELKADFPTVERLSIALGVVESSLTPKDPSKQLWPADLAGTVDRLAAAFDSFASELAAAPALAAAPSTAAKVKAVADAVWSKLQKGSYSKDLQHAQHVFNFAAALLPGGMPGVKKQLDCAGVVTTTYALCQALSQRQPSLHADLAAARMQISEDHCWIQLSPAGRREGSVEVTTDTAAKRGLPVAADAWGGWLYTGGAAVLCSPHQALAALVTSLNPGISGGKKGADSEEVQLVQRRLLELLLRERPDALYPAALCALADLHEIAEQDALDTARDQGDAAEVARLLQPRQGDARDLFERAIQLAAGGGAAPATGVPLEPAPAGVTGTAAVLEDACGTAPGVDAGAPAAPCEQQAAAAEAAASSPAAAAVAAADGAADGAAQQPANGNVLAADSETANSSVPVGGGEAANGNLNGGGPCTDPVARGSNGSVGAGRQWYVYSYLAAFLARRAEFLASCAEVLPPLPAAEQAGTQQQPHAYWQQAVETYAEALQVASRGAAVLAQYRYQPATDEQLHKDVDAVLDEVIREGLAAVAKAQRGGRPLEDPTLLAPLLRLFEGVCHLLTGRPKPSHWVALLLKAAKLFSPEAREAAAAAVAGDISSRPMLDAQPLWRDLKPVPLRPVLESTGVGGATADGEAGEGRAAKRRRA